VLRGLFASKRDEVTGEWRNFHVEHNELYSSPNILRVIKSRKIRWAINTARLGEVLSVYTILV
jgi:hypothetical protein